MTILQKAQAILNEKNTKITAGNLKYGVEAFGVEGTCVELVGETKTVTPTVNEQVIVPSTGNGLTEVTVNGVTAAIDANIIAENIKAGVTILGVTGTYTGNEPEEHNDVGIEEPGEVQSIL